MGSAFPPYSPAGVAGIRIGGGENELTASRLMDPARHGHRGINCKESINVKLHRTLDSDLAIHDIDRALALQPAAVLEVKIVSAGKFAKDMKKVALDSMFIVADGSPRPLAPVR